MSGPKISDPANCTCASLRRLTRLVTRHFAAGLAPADLKPAQFTLLATLAGAGSKTKGELAEILVLDRTTLTRNLRPLLAAGLVGEQAQADRRIRQIAITRAGRKRLDVALPLWRAAQQELVARLGLEHWRRLMAELNLAQDRTPGG